MELLKTDGVSKVFGGLKAVSNFDIEINEGELIGLIGPNGAGKTTAFNLLTGVYQQTTGTIDVAGKRLVGIKPYEVAKNLPYGAQRRLEIARALATKPKLLLLDEPAAGMNPQETQELMEMIRWIRKEFGLSILLIEHDMSLVMGICERIYVLEYGCIIASGTPEEIQKNPEVIKAYLGGEV